MLTYVSDLTNRRVDLPELQERLRRRREDLRLDQESLAERAQVSAGYISRLERGAVPNPKVFDLVQVAEALDMSVSELLAAKTEPTVGDDDLRAALAAAFPDNAERAARLLSQIRLWPARNQAVALEMYLAMADVQERNEQFG